MKSEPRNVPASIRARLLNLSKARQEDFNGTLIRYVSERFLYRLGKAECCDSYVLKGAMLLTVTLDDLRYRPTRDIDVLRNGTDDRQSILGDISDICSVEAPSDGLVFDASSATLEDIRENNRYHGVRIEIPVRLGNARVTLQIDMGFGDAVYPAPQTMTIKPLLDHDPPEVLAYPMHAVVAEKFEAIVSIGMLTSRMKDFFDIYAIASTRRFNRRDLIESIEATFHRRGTALPTDLPVVLTDTLLHDPTKQTQWAAFVRRIERDPTASSFELVLSTARNFLRVAWDREMSSDISAWSPSEGWHPPSQ